MVTSGKENSMVMVVKTEFLLSVLLLLETKNVPLTAANKNGTSFSVNITNSI